MYEVRDGGVREVARRMDVSGPGPEHRMTPGYPSQAVSDTSPSGSVGVFALLRLSA